MPKYANALDTWITLRGIPDEAVRTKVTQIICKAIRLEKMPDGFSLTDEPLVRDANQCDAETKAWLHGEGVPAAILDLHAWSLREGQGVMVRPRLGYIGTIVDWVGAVMLASPVNYGRKIKRMCLRDMWTAIMRHHQDQLRADQEARAKAGRLDELRMIECPVLHVYADGWRWVHVSGVDALKAEGNLMGHCVGNGAYTRLNGMSAILSLRDPEGMPRVTAQMHGDHLVMAKGRSNSEPVNYRKHVDHMVRHCGAYLLMHEATGWATEDHAAEVEATKASRDAARIAKAIADRDYSNLSTIEAARQLNRPNGEHIAYQPDIDMDAQDRIVALLDDHETMLMVQRAVAAGETRLGLGGAVVRPGPTLEAYAALQDRRAVHRERFVPVVTIEPGGLFELPGGYALTAGMDVQADRWGNAILSNGATMTLRWAREMLAARPEIDPDFYNTDLGIPFDPSAPAANKGAPAAEGGPKP